MGMIPPHRSPQDALGGNMDIEWSNSPVIGAVLVLAFVLITPQIAKAFTTMAVVGVLLFGGALWMGYAPEEVQTVVTDALQSITQDSGLCATTSASSEATGSKSAADKGTPKRSSAAPIGALAMGSR